ncbi:MAG: ATP-binding protein [Acidimicrobiales bacterium]
MTTPIMPPRRRLTGSAVAVLTAAALIAVMLPFRHHLDIAIVALVLVVPVVIGAAIGGFLAGLTAVVAGFLGYDLFFIPPYGTLTVGAAENWAALAVYVVVMVLVSRVVDRVWLAEAASRQSERDTARLFELSELLVGDRPPADLFGIIVNSVKEAFELSAVVLLLPRPVGDSDSSTSALESVAVAGRDLDPTELAHLVPAAGTPSSLRSQPSPRLAEARPAGGQTESLETVVLTVGDRTVGLLGIAGLRLAPQRRELLGAFANHIALAIERSKLRDQAVRMKLLEEVDRHRRYLFGAVSHDLRTPIATIKASASALLDPSVGLTRHDRVELATLIEHQSDRLERVVSNLLDMSRIQAGALVLDLEHLSVEELFDSTLEALGPTEAKVVTSTPPDNRVTLEADRTLLVEALVNLLENALRYSPEGAAVEMTATTTDSSDRPVRLSVTDHGPGIPAGDRTRLFGVFKQGADSSSRPSGGSGLGLSIAQAFVEAHGGSIRIEDAEPGTSVVVELPAAPRESVVTPEMSKSR